MAMNGFSSSGRSARDATISVSEASRLAAFKREMLGTESADEVGIPVQAENPAYTSEREKAQTILDAQAAIDAKHNGGKSAKSSS